VVHFDRDTHGVDVMENVFRGVQVLSDSTEPSADTVDREVRAWFSGTAVSTVHIRIRKPDER
jgi:hypothetical protein